VGRQCNGPMMSTRDDDDHDDDAYCFTTNPMIISYIHIFYRLTISGDLHGCTTYCVNDHTV